MPCVRMSLSCIAVEETDELRHDIKRGDECPAPFASFGRE
jgi:hypothetical protein